MNKIIKELRIKAKLSQKELAEMLGVTQGAVSQWETNESRPQTGMLSNLARVLGCTVDDFFQDYEQEGA